MSIKPDADFLCVKEVASLLRTGVRTVYRLLAANRIPPPIRLTKKLILWRKSTFLAWLDTLEAAWPAPAPKKKGRAA